MATCEHCTGTHYLADDPSLGACVCVTAEALQRVEAALAARDRTVAALTATPPIGERIDAAIAALTDAQTEIAELERDRDGHAEHAASMVAALRAYLPTVGFSADPVTTSNMDAALAGLVEAAGL